jgi:hypothetical protein
MRKTKKMSLTVRNELKHYLSTDIVDFIIRDYFGKSRKEYKVMYDQIIVMDLDMLDAFHPRMLRPSMIVRLLKNFSAPEVDEWERSGKECKK